MRTATYLVLATLPLGLACTKKSTPTGEDFQDVPADMVMVGMTEYMTDNGLRRAQLKGDTAYVFDDSSKVKIVGVDLTIYNEQGQETAHLTAKKGDFNSQTQGMIARGHAVLVTKGDKPATIETEELNYDPQQHRLWSNVTSTITEGGSRVVGDGFTSDDKFVNKSITRPRGRVQTQRIKF